MSAWPYTPELPGAGRIDEHELDAACWRKRVSHLTRDQLLAVDETAGLCGICGGDCPTPQACELPAAAPRVFFLLQRAFDRAPRLTMAICCAVVLVLLGLAGKADQLADESIEIHANVEEVQP